jgi:hypothetical protein
MENGTHTMPVIGEKLLRVRGQQYFVNMEITGTQKKTVANPGYT